MTANKLFGDDYVTDAELAREVKRSIPTIRRWRRAGLLPAPVRLGRLALYSRKALLARLAAQGQPPARPRAEAPRPTRR